MTALRRRAADPFIPILAIALAIVTLACGPGTPAPTRPSAAASRAASPKLTPVPGGPASPSGAATARVPTTTDTEFGTIFDALPASFPKLAGQEPTETGAGPTSGTFAANVTAAQAAAAIETGLSAQGWTVDAGSPLEDGSIVLEATHPAAGCKTEVRFTPLSGTVIMSVLYGASCPFS